MVRKSREPRSSANELIIEHIYRKNSVSNGNYARLYSATKSPVNLRMTLYVPVEIEKINVRPATAIPGIDRVKEVRFSLYCHLKGKYGITYRGREFDYKPANPPPPYRPCQGNEMAAI